jgi:hypothetical protein
MSMDLDIETLLSGCALVLLVVAAVFATTAALRHNDEANRAWTASFAAALCVVGLEAIYGVDAMPPVVLAVVDATSLFALGAMWAGCRLLDGRARSLVLIPFVVALIVMRTWPQRSGSARPVRSPGSPPPNSSAAACDSTSTPASSS